MSTAVRAAIGFMIRLHRPALASPDRRPEPQVGYDFDFDFDDADDDREFEDDDLDPHFPHS
ncbi:hypothetical protein GCM10010112_24470 [Actinoplanes lobatus]|uniref:Uncharacterized protein n=1 Tax=Actinoplanes lobatus TaxID=113568 RepID=A0A7W7MIJ3_9ACTN|nr:hypothetical protein [Actinoplanes lobatus]MBB4751488.1 hypothetical protein [Actinoplanes lobatus]GGN64353.1 hypothetical protein GCM10010112_24470 [Actinoplanes lobatus]GIE41098.1 hypothetical protein Alo02nite_39960 [Actinoplanes lobatus]